MLTKACLRSSGLGILSAFARQPLNSYSTLSNTSRMIDVAGLSTDVMGNFLPATSRWFDG
jgi:hypothetical protein